MTRPRSLAVLARRLGTALRLMALGRAGVAGRPHEPLPDLAWPGLCGIDGLELDDPLHGRRKSRRRDSGQGGGEGPASSTPGEAAS